MRIVLAAAVLMALAGSPAQAQTATVYPWCTTGASQEVGARNCGFVSFEQCLDSARGNGQNCEQNPFYQGPRPAAKSQRKQPANPSR